MTIQRSLVAAVAAVGDVVFLHAADVSSYVEKGYRSAKRSCGIQGRCMQMGAQVCGYACDA